MLVSLFERYGYATIFLASLIEPDATLLTSSFLSHRGYFEIQTVLLLVILGSASASQAYFWLARRLHGNRFLARLQSPSVAGKVDRYGLGLVVVSRFLWGFRAAIAATCGLSGMSAVAFFFADLTGAVLWALVTSLFGTAIGQALVLIVDDLRPHEWWVADTLFAATVVVVIWRAKRRRP